MSGHRTVPVLVTDSGEVVAESKRIVEWAERNPARSAARLQRSSISQAISQVLALACKSSGQSVRLPRLRKR